MEGMHPVWMQAARHHSCRRLGLHTAVCSWRTGALTWQRNNTDWSRQGTGGMHPRFGCRPPDTTVAEAWNYILLSAYVAPDCMLGSEKTLTRAWESHSGRRWHGCQRPSVCSPIHVQGHRDGWASGWTAGLRVVRPLELLNHLLNHQL